MKNMKKKKIFSILFFSLAMLLFLYVMHCNRSESEIKIHNTAIDKIQIEIAEKKYINNPTTENLFILCANLLHTNEIEMIKQYYPLLLSTENIEIPLSNYLAYNDVPYTNVEAFYNTLLSCYLIVEGMSEDCNTMELAKYLKMQQGYSFIEVIHISMLVYFEDSPTELKFFLENLNECKDYVEDYHKEEISLIKKRYSK